MVHENTFGLDVSVDGRIDVSVDVRIDIVCAV